MTRMELALALGAVVLASAALGWALRWLWGRLTEGPPAAAARLDALSAELEAVEAERDALADRAALREAELSARLAETEARLSRTLGEREAELSAVMETVGALRREIAALREDGRRRAGG